MITSNFLITLNLNTLDPNVQTFISVAGITNPVQINALNTLVLYLKSKNVWNKLNAAYPFIGGTSVTHSYNLINTGLYRITWGGTTPPTHNSSGVTGTGAAAGQQGRGDTGYIIPVGNQNNFHISAYVRNNVDDQAVMGTVTTATSKYTQIYPKNGGVFYGDVNDTSGAGVANANSQGHYIANRIVNTQNVQYKNGTAVNTQVVTSVVPPITTVGLLSRNSATGFTQWSTYNIAFATIGLGLTASEAGFLYTGIQAFNTTLNRQV